MHTLRLPGRLRNRWLLHMKLVCICAVLSALTCLLCWLTWVRVVCLTVMCHVQMWTVYWLHLSWVLLCVAESSWLMCVSMML